MKLDPAEIGYVAGMIDGEGHVGIAKRHHYFVAHIGISNTDKAIIDRIVQIFNTWGVGHCVCWRSRGGTRRDDCEIVVESGPRILKLGNIIGPYLVGKRKQLELMLEFVKLRQALPRWTTKIGSKERSFSTYELELVEKVRSLNRRGVPNPKLELSPTGTP